MQTRRKLNSVGEKGGERDMIEQLVLDGKEACKALKISRSTLCRLIKKGKIRAIKIGGKNKIPKSEIVRIVSGKEN